MKARQDLTQGEIFSNTGVLRRSACSCIAEAAAHAPVLCNTYMTLSANTPTTRKSSPPLSLAGARAAASAAEYRDRMATESEWARKLNAAQLEGLQKLKSLEQMLEAKSLEAEKLAGKNLQLDKAMDTIRMLEEVNDQERQAVAAAVQQSNELQESTQVFNTTSAAPLLELL